MASFFRKCSMGNACKNWTKDVHFSNETTPKEGSAASNPRPKSPLDVNFEKETGVTTGLGLVPHLANLWLQDPFDRRIVFGTINMGVEDFSRSLIRVSVANTYELITFNLNPSPRLFSYPSPPSSLFSPLSHTPLMGSLPEIWGLPDDICDLPIDPDYYLFLRDECHEEDELSFGSDHHSEVDLTLRKSYSDEHIYDGSFDGMKAQNINHLAHEKENTKVNARGTNPNPTDDTIYDDNCSNYMEQPRSFVGGLSATFGVRAKRSVPNNEGRQYPTPETVMHCDFCKKPLNMEHNDSVFFKIKYSCSCRKQCKKVEVDNEEDWKKGFTKAPKYRLL